MKLLLTTMPADGEARNWTTPEALATDGANPVMPLGILSLASNLPPDVECFVLDPPSLGLTIDETVEAIEAVAPDVLGLSVVTHRCWAMSELLRRTTAPYKAVGGPHATLYAETILRQGADAVFVGALAEKEFAHAVRHADRGRKYEWRGVIPCYTGINTIHFPDRRLIDYKFYWPRNQPLFKSHNRMSMYSSLGCPHHCTYCNVQNRQMQWKDTGMVIGEMLTLYQLGSESIHLLDDNFNINRGHLEGIIKAREVFNMTKEWSARGQVRMDLSLVPRMAATGFKRIHVGIEALDDTILASFNKAHRLKDIERFCKVMNDNGVDVLAYIICGSPLETKDYRNALPERIRGLGIKYPFFNTLFPEVNSTYYDCLFPRWYMEDHWYQQIQEPVRDFVIPYPYGEAEGRRQVARTQELVEEFKS